MTTTQTVLIAGATGNMGSRIAHYLARKEGVQLRALVRNRVGRDERQQAILNRLQQSGIKLIEGDLNDLGSLKRAATRVDTILSAVNGNGSREVELTGQLTLLEAAKQMGVSRFIPSDFSADYTKIRLGDHHNYDFRIQVAEAVKASGLNYTFIMNGAFMEVMFAPIFGAYDFENGTAEAWGDGNTKMDLTTMDDTAQYTAEAITDPTTINTIFQIAGDQLTRNEIISAYQEVTGQRLTAPYRGTIEDLQAHIEVMKSDPNPWMYIRLQYLWLLESGISKLEHLVNDRYPMIHPTTVRELFTSQISTDK